MGDYLKEPMRSLLFSPTTYIRRVPSVFIFVLGVGLLASLSACGPYDPNYGGPYGGYNGGYNGGYYNDGWEARRDIDRSRQERRELERERERAQAERERLERERSNSHGGWRNPPPPPPSRPAPQVDRCPPGFSPSERKCSPDERRRGCRDIRTPSGLGCVSR
jgi:hypothetical protein